MRVSFGSVGFGPWAPARKIFGMIRFMAASGCARKFDVNAYIAAVQKLS